MVQSFRFKVSGSKFQVQSFRFKVDGSKLMVQSSKFKVCNAYYFIKGPQPVTHNP
jgi:hypothetical protein